MGELRRGIGGEAGVDMLAAARDAQWSALTFLGAGSIKLVAPAKVNLFLGVGTRRADGYHEVDTVMHALTLHDVLHMHAGFADDAEYGRAESDDGLAVGGEAGNLLVSIDCADKSGTGALDVPARENIVFRAVDTLARKLGRTERGKLSFRIEKNIPAQGGLGGGSSDAAAALVGAAHLWGLPADDPVLIDVARGIGADVAFFLQGGCARLSGTGAVFERSLVPRKESVVLVKPQAGVSTSAAYRAFDAAPVDVAEHFRDRLDEAVRAEEVPLVNNLAAAAESLEPELGAVSSWLRAQDGVCSAEGEPAVLLCGSGATTFAVVRDFAAACAIAAEAQKRGWWARATAFSSLRAARVAVK